MKNSSGQTWMRIIDYFYREWDSREVRLLVAVYFAISLALTIYLRADNADTTGFSAEIGNVAASLASGNGISGAFSADSGATAWCPLLYVLAYALVFLIFGVKTVPAFWAIMVIRCALLSWSLYLLLRIDYSQRFNKHKWLIFAVYTAYTFLVIYRTGPKDAMFAVYLSVLLLYTIQRILAEGFHANKWLIISLAVMLPFANISLAIGLLLSVWLISLKVYPRQQEVNFRYQHALLVSVIVFSGYALWGLRNTVVLDKFIPYKSNLWFEMYISNVEDNDGILKYSNYKVLHPFLNSGVRSDYMEAGEAVFLERYHSQSTEYLATNTWDFIGKVWNRFVNIFIIAESENDIEPADIENFNDHDLQMLVDHGKIIDGYWICLETDPADFERDVQQMPLTGDKAAIIKDWKQKFEISDQRVRNIKNLQEFLEGTINSIVPFIALCICLLVPVIRRNQVFITAFVLFVLGIGPYLLISWTPRYQTFQIGFFTVFVFQTLSVLIDHFQKKWIK